MIAIEPTDRKIPLRLGRFVIDAISSTYNYIRPSHINLIVYLLTFWRPPRWLFDRLLRGVVPMSENEELSPNLGLALRFVYLTVRSLSHLRFLEFSTLPGRAGLYAWKLGLVDVWQKRLRHRLPHPGLRSVRARQQARVEKESRSAVVTLGAGLD